jgi:DNA-binding MarR family transcriptional regulator
LRWGGYYLGTNVSYNVKKLVEMGFLDRSPSSVDRRSICIKLTEKGREIYVIVDESYNRHVSKVENISGISTDDFTLMNKVLRRLERFLTDQILYRL